MIGMSTEFEIMQLAGQMVMCPRKIDMHRSVDIIGYNVEFQRDVDTR